MRVRSFRGGRRSGGGSSSSGGGLDVALVWYERYMVGDRTVSEVEAFKQITAKYSV